MTQKQYDKAREEGIEAYLTDEDGKTHRAIYLTP